MAGDTDALVLAAMGFVEPEGFPFAGFRITRGMNRGLARDFATCNAADSILKSE